MAKELIGEFGAVTLLYLATETDDEIEAWMIEKILEMMEKAETPKVVEHLMIVFWVLLRNPKNREVRLFLERKCFS
eukprot:7210482-Pyramimonas_sp.AAC.1